MESGQGHIQPAWLQLRLAESEARTPQRQSVVCLLPARRASDRCKYRGPHGPAPRRPGTVLGSNQLDEPMCIVPLVQEAARGIANFLIRCVARHWPFCGTSIPHIEMGGGSNIGNKFLLDHPSRTRRFFPPLRFFVNGINTQTARICRRRDGWRLE